MNDSSPEAASRGRVLELPDDVGRSRRDLVWRLMAAIPLNYAFTALATAFAARLLPLEAGQASVAASLASFLLLATLALVAFAVRSIARLWVVLGVSCVVMVAWLWLPAAMERLG